MSTVEHAIKYFQDNQEQLTASYFDLVRIPSISTDPAHHDDMIKAADFLSSYLKRLGFEKVEIFPTDMHPILFAEKKSANPDANPY